MLPVILNLVFFKLVWAASLAGVVYGYAWWGLGALCCFMIWHGATVPTARADFVLAITAVAIGLVLDTAYVRSGLISYEGNMLWSGAAPLWILALWANFALTMNGCMRWLQTRKPLAAALAFIFGPLSYYGGIALGTATVTGEQWLLFAVIGLAWAVALPLLLSLAVRYADRFSTPLGATVGYPS
ncbi:MAG: DUF2878 domain-containing protein [Gammaproteobacteria bacterium]|nr:DUF2878 domain-containing protein [Gammaproteobacteria bacterium]